MYLPACFPWNMSPPAYLPKIWCNGAQNGREKPAHCRPVVEVYQDLEKMIQRASDVSENITVHGKDLTELPGWFYRRVIEQESFI